MPKVQIAIIDFGSQYTHLITRRIRQLGVLAKIYTPDVKAGELKGVKGLILSGGPNSVHDQSAVKYDVKLFKLGVPILGLCYGHQLIAQHFGGVVKAGKTKEYGLAKLRLTRTNKLFKAVPSRTDVWMSHGDSVQVLPVGFEADASTIDCPVAAMANEQAGIYSLQFHPEVAHTKKGQTILNNFIFRICQAKRDWSLDRYWQEIIGSVKRQVGKRKVFLLVSGGVDSTICFAMLEKVLGKKKVFGLHIDNGFMRLNESAQVKRDLAKAGFDDLVVVDAETEFLQATKSLVDPESKRLAVGRTFLEIKDQVMKYHQLNQRDWVLGQGTIYPDTIETGGTKHADKIKTHHNRVDEILKLMKMGALIEPLVDLYKDEVRLIGKKLKLPASLLNRHPFPGPGLSVRTLCSNGQEKIKQQSVINKKLQKIVGTKLKVSVLPLKSVGVQGDNRTYRHPAIIAGLTGWSKLNQLSIRITNELTEINRVVYLLSPEKMDLASLRTKEAYLTKDRLDLLRAADDIVMQEIGRAKIYDNIWQFPVVLAPLTVRGGEAVILRPIESKEAMTVNFYRMPKKVLNRIVKKITVLPGVDLVLYDVTNKPPGTIEWE